MKNVLAGIILALTGLSVNAQHTVNLKSGEKMNGKVQSMKDGIINFEFKGNVMKLKESEVTSIFFNEGPASGTGTGSPKSSSAEIIREPGEKQVTVESCIIRYKVADRIISKPPLVSNLTQEKGTVVVDVTVDKYGHVKKAIPGAKGTTTTSEYLLTKAKQAAESTLFDNVPKAPLEQSGYMIIPF